MRFITYTMVVQIFYNNCAVLIFKYIEYCGTDILETFTENINIATKRF